MSGLHRIFILLFTVTATFRVAVAGLSDLDELSSPLIPDSLPAPASRTTCLLTHFWENVDFRDTLRSHNRELLEQNFAGFIALFPHADTLTQSLAVNRLMQAAEKDAVAYRLLADIAEKYLYRQESPAYCENYFIFFLEAMVSTPVLGEYEKVRPAYLLEMARKNRPGMQAADFAYRTREGKSFTLQQTPGERLLLFFYDPDCDHCREAMAEMNADPCFCQAVGDGRLTVLAICSGASLEAWEHTKDEMPAGWIVGFETGDIQDKELYGMPAMPTLYLLDHEKKVILKEASLPLLFHTLF